MDPVDLFAREIIAYSAEQATSEALRVLWALGAVAPEPYGSKARRTAQRLLQGGLAEPSWGDALGGASAVSAWLSFDPVDDDGVSVMVGFEGPTGEHTLGIYVDHNLGGIAKDGFAVATSIDDVVERLRESDETDALEYRQITMADAAARWRHAFEMTDMTIDTAVSEDLHHLRALLLARLSTMPFAGQRPANGERSEDEREELLAEFLASQEAVGLRDVNGVAPDQVEDLAFQVMTFSLDYVCGRPLRFSPIMVEIFSLEWAPYKIAASDAEFKLLPDVLAAWIRFVGRRRAIPESSITEAVAAVFGCAPEMIQLSRDPANWGPAKTIAVAVIESGIDITDQAALYDFMDEVNRDGGIDVLADSLAARR